MFLTFMKIINIILFIAPFAVIRYYPFREKLRVSGKTIILIYLNLIIIQTLIFCYLTTLPVWNYTINYIFRLIFLILYAALSFILIKENIFKQLYVWSLIFFLAGLIIGNAKYIEINYFEEYSISNPYIMMNLFITLQILIFFPPIINIINKKLKPFIYSTSSHIWNFVWSIPIFLYITVILSTGSTNEKNIYSVHYLIIRLSIFIGMILINIVIVETLKQISDNSRLAESIKLTTKQLELEHERYQLITKYIEDTKRVRHDIRHHLFIINNYLANNNIDMLKDYLCQFQEGFPEVPSAPLCKNYTADVIVRYYVDLAQECDINVQVNLDIAQNIGVSDSDICILFGNLLENAIDACKMQKKYSRFITLNATSNGSHMIIALDNSYENNIRLDNKVFLSSKREGFGIGISSIRAVVAKYEGTTEFIFKDNVFHSSIYLQLNTKVSPTENCM